MLVNGKEIADEILKVVAEETKVFKFVPRLSVVTCAPNFETKRYLEMKKQKSASVGISLNVVELPDDSTTKEVIDCVNQVAGDSAGLIVQLPLPGQIDRDQVLAAVPVAKDPDGFKYGQDAAACMSPVVGAIDEISKKYEVDWKDKTVVVLGEGRLVGLPALHYATLKGGKVTVLTEVTYSEPVLKSADIIVTGIGKPHFISPDVVKEGVIIFDAGTSEAGGELVGDVAPSVSDVASLFTPVPGGIGPITIAYLLRNLVRLVRQ